MSAYTWFEFAVIAALAIWSTWIVLGRLLPGVRSRLLRALGKTPQPASSGCGSGCSSCSGCGSGGSTAARKSCVDTPVRFDRPR